MALRSKTGSVGNAGKRNTLIVIIRGANLVRGFALAAAVKIFVLIAGMIVFESLKETAVVIRDIIESVMLVLEETFQLSFG